MTVDEDVRRRLARAVAQYCPPWLADSRDDLVQMAIVRVLRSSATVDNTDAWIRRLAYTVVVDEIRRLRRRSEVGMSPSLPERIANSGDIDPETRARGAQIGAVLVECVEELPTDRRRAVVLYLQSHTVPEVAELLGCDTKRASNLVYRGLADLRAALAARGVSP